jgi:hypothetical protein
MSGTPTLYERLTRFPLGTILFSRALGFRVPYVSTIHPHVEIKDGTGDTVLNAMIVFYISERKSANRTA